MTENNNLDELFKDRYSEKDERYQNMAETGFEKVIVVHPWDPRRNNNNRGRGRGWGGGGGGGRGGWQNRDGGNQNRGGWRGGSSYHRGDNYGGRPWRGRGGEDRRRQHD